MDSQEAGLARVDHRGQVAPGAGEFGSVTLVDYMGSDLRVVQVARHSYNEGWRAGEDEGSDRKLMKYLWHNDHGTPFEAVTFTFLIKAPIFVFRQWHRHRTWAYNELSARYRELPEEFYIPGVHDIGKQAKKNKQGRDTSGTMTPLEEASRGAEILAYRLLCEAAFKVYRELLEAGWPRELARMCLPLSTYSVMYGTVNLRNLLGFLTLRCHSHAQPEIQVYARGMRDLAKLVCPVAVQVWSDWAERMPYAELERRYSDLVFENERLRQGGSNR